MQRLALTVVALFCCGEICNAQVYPSRTVRLVVPFPPGGGTDLVARAVAQKLSEGMGQPVIVDNRPGANGIIGTDIVAKAKPDGYTLLITIASHAINPALYPKLPFNTDADFEPVTLMAEYAYILVVHPSLPVRSVAQLIALAKSQAGKLSYASSGNGSGPHLGMELFKTLTRIDMVHVPYKGAGPANTDLIAGHVQVFLNNFLASIQMIRAGRLRALAVTSEKRSRAMPELPTVAESGVPGYSVTSWYGMLVPAGTPRAVVATLHDGVVRALRQKDVNERLSSEGAEPVAGTPEEFKTFLTHETNKWGRVVKNSGVRAAFE